ncbi:MAG: tetratricopeptide repeat protein [Deltaproteobacteria bacterium]|nr:tetratricopeptide repeat protein [Deltaproteobacteria bacterium]
MSTDGRNVSMQKTQLIRVGDILSKLGNSEEALKYQQKALALTREGRDERTEARVLTRIGTLYQIMGKPRTALEHYKEANDIHARLGDRRGINGNLLQIALVNSGLGDSDAAVADVKKAFEIAQSSEDRGMLWKAYFILGRTLEGKKSYGEALESYRKAIEVLEAMEVDVVEDSDEDDFIFGGKTNLFETTLRVLMALAKKDPDGAYDNQALRIVEKLKATEFEATLSKINVENFSDLPHELLIKEKSLKLALRKLNGRLAEERTRVNPDLEQIRKLLAERREKEKSFVDLKELLRQKYPSYADLRYPPPLSIRQLQREVVDQDEAILEFMVTRKST